jgi:hypothetical protein
MTTATWHSDNTRKTVKRSLLACPDIQWTHRECIAGVPVLVRTFEVGYLMMRNLLHLIVDQSPRSCTGLGARRLTRRPLARQSYRWSARSDA